MHREDDYVRIRQNLCDPRMETADKFYNNHIVPLIRQVLNGERISFARWGMQVYG